jgi:hypothetical protein
MLSTAASTSCLGHRRYQDLRDSYAIQLITAGIQLGNVSVQPGHADVAVPAHHFARWIGGLEYREPVQLREDDVPADFIGRLAYEPPASCQFEPQESHFFDPAAFRSSVGRFIQAQQV